MANAEIILTENIPSLGAEADIVSVRRGYARNFLIPQGKAIEVTAGSLRKINHLKAKRAEREALEMTAAEELASKINKLQISFSLETGETGKAFGSITAKDITDRLLQELKGIELPKHAVTLEKPIKETGEHKIPVKLHSDVIATLHIVAGTAHVPKDTAAGDDDSAKKPRKKAPAKG